MIGPQDLYSSVSLEIVGLGTGGKIAVPVVGYGLILAVVMKGPL